MDFENIDKNEEIEIFLNGRKISGYSFNKITRLFNHDIKLNEGENTYLIRLTNGCGTIEKNLKFSIELAPSCGVKIEMINNKSEFCLTTATGIITSNDLMTNSKFAYNGQASSLYFKATENGKAIVNNVEYNLTSGLYYHFVGFINVEISKNRPGMNNRWSVCVSSTRPPLFGKGNAKPANPCTEINDVKSVVKPNVREKPNTRKVPDIRESPSINKKGSGGDTEEKVPNVKGRILQTPSKSDGRSE